MADSFLPPIAGQGMPAYLKECVGASTLRAPTIQSCKMHSKLRFTYLNFIPLTILAAMLQKL